MPNKSKNFIKMSFAPIRSRSPPTLTYMPKDPPKGEVREEHVDDGDADEGDDPLGFLVLQS